MNLAVIPARGGSKRIKQKNTRLFCGSPIIEYSIQAANQSGLFARIVVSTDCSEIAAVAASSGAAVIDRPSELADDFAPLMPVVKHAIEDQLQYLRDLNDGLVCCLLATAPFVTGDDLKNSLQRLRGRQADFVVPVTSFPYPVLRALKVVDDRLAFFWPEHELTRSQDLPEAFHDAGQFYWGTTQAWLTRDRILSSGAIPYQMPRHRVQDLDTLEDWEQAERLFIVNGRRSNHES
jgi:N-acylneuraminate cytidylyltransferase